MSKYTPPAVATVSLDIVKAPYFGGEFSLYLTNTAAVKVGEIQFTAANVAVWVPSPSAVLLTAGTDLQVVAKTPIASPAGALAVVLAALDNSGTPVVVSANASFAPPARANNQTFNFPRGVAQDLILNPHVVHSTTRALATNVATIVSPNHGLPNGQHVTTTLFGNPSYDVVNQPITVVDVNTFTYPATGANETTTADITGTITPVGIGALFTSITGLTSVTNGSANVILEVFQLPPMSAYELIAPAMEIDFNTKSRMAKGIDSGMEADAFVKLGKTHPGEFSAGLKFAGLVEQNAGGRYEGQRCTAMLVGLKEFSVASETYVFTQAVLTIKPKLPEGDGEVTAEMTGKFVEHLFFIAP